MAETSFSVFLCHNSLDKPSVEIIGRRLMERGIKPWLDRWNLTPGEPWVQEIEHAMGSCSAVAVFFGPASGGRFQRSEEDLAIADRLRVIPVLLPGAVKGDEHSFLKTRTWVEFPTVDDDEALRVLICGIENKPPGPPPIDGLAPRVDCPYPGLASFGVAQANYFFGRKELTASLIERIRGMLSRPDAVRLLGLVGGSGSGKSSLARAGVLYALRHDLGIAGSSEWPVLDLTPGGDPAKSLALKLIEFEGGPAGAVRLIATVDSVQGHKDLLDSAAGMALKDAPKKRLIVLVDQFEEVFSSGADLKTRNAFIDNLICAATTRGGQIVVLLTLRSDFYGNCAEHAELAAILPGNHRIVTALAEKELRDAIVLPAQQVGCDVEPSLVNLLLKQSENQPGSLPTLQFVLFKMWQAKKGRELTMTDYLRIGQLDGALDQHAEEIYGALNKEQQEICRNVMRRLATPWGDDRFTRKRLRMDALLPHSGAPAAVKAVEEVIGRLAGPDARLLVISVPDPAEKKAYVEVAHEALIGSWQRFKTWLNDDREFLLWKERLRVSLADWVRYQRDKKCLLHEPVLAEAVQRRKQRESDLDDDEKEFIRNSVTEKRRHAIVFGIEVAVAVLVISGAIAWFTRQMREQRAITASRSFIATNPWCAVAAALYADERMKSAQSQAVLEEAVQAAGSPALELGGPVYDVRFSPKGEYVATASEDKTAILWSAAQHTALRRIELPGRVLAVAFSGDGTRVAAGDGDGDIEIRHLPDFGRVSLTKQEDGVSAIAFNNDGGVLVTGSIGGKIRFSPKGTTPPDAPGAAVASIVWSPDGRHFATGAADGKVKIRATDGTVRTTLEHAPGTADVVGFRESGKTLLTVELRGKLRSWSVLDGKELPGPEQAGSVIAAALSGDGKVLATARSDGSLTVGAIRITRRDETVTKLALNTDGSRLAVASDAGKVRVYELARKTLVEVGRRKLAEAKPEKLNECPEYR